MTAREKYESPEAVRAELAELLEPDGWLVSLGDRPDGFAIVLEHPLSHEFRAGFGADAWSERVTELLARPEIQRIAEAPDDVLHASLLGKIRVAASAGNWLPDVIPAVARVLAAEHLLTEDEAAWLAEAGAAWGAS